MKNLERKLSIKQKIIDRQNEEIQLLKKENESLKEQLELEKNKPRDGYERAKTLITTLEQNMDIYNQSIEDLKKSKQFYDKAYKELLELKGKYKRQMERFMKSLPADDLE